MSLAEVDELAGEEGTIKPAPPTSDEIILATAGYDHSIRIWQACSGVCLRTMQHPDSQVNALEIMPDNIWIAAAGFQHIRMYDLHSSNPNPVINFEGVNKNVTSVGFQEDGKWMYTGGEDATAKIWDLRTRNLQCQKIYECSAPVNCACLHPNQCELFIGDQAGVIHMWDVRGGNHNDQIIPEVDASIQCIDVDATGQMVAAVNNKGNCYIWNLKDGTPSKISRLVPKMKLSAHKNYALKCKFSPDSAVLATTSADQTAKIWNTDDFTLIKTLSDPAQRWVWDLAFTSDSRYLFTGSSDNFARLWNLESGAIQREYAGHQKAVISIAFKDT